MQKIDADNTAIWNSLHCVWRIKEIDEKTCECVYDINLEFANPLYSAVTRTFFDLLAYNVNTAFEKRALELYRKNFQAQPT